MKVEAMEWVQKADEDDAIEALCSANKIREAIRTAFGI